MNSFISRCGKWLETVAVVVNVSNPLKIGIVLLEDSLAKAFLYFKENSDDVIACFRIDFSVVACLKMAEMEIYFQDYNNYKISLICPDLRMGDALQSQITISSRIAGDSACPFHQENYLFLQKIGQIAESIPTVDWVAPLFPLCSNEDAYNTWIRRTDALNSCFYTTAVKSQINFITLNVERKTPENDEDFSFIFEYSSQVICVVLEDVDITIQGQTPQYLKSLWHTCLIRAAQSSGYRSLFHTLCDSVYVEVFVAGAARVPVKVTETWNLKIGGYTKHAAFVSLMIGESSVTFCGTQLQFLKNDLEVRNTQLQMISEELRRVNSDYLFIVGDLSYRVELSFKEAIEAVEKRDIAKLLQNDQLLHKSKLERFTEGEIKFLPTYKFDPQSDTYDANKYTVPSYHGRILCLNQECTRAINSDKMVFETDIIRNTKSFNLPSESLFGIENGVKNYPNVPTIIEYAPFFNIRISTHRPLRCIYELEVLQIDEEKKEVFNKTRMQRKDEMTTLCIPQCTVECNSLVSTGVDTDSFINVSCATAEWNAEYDSSMIEVRPVKGTLRPGEMQEIKIIKKGLRDSTLLTINVLDGPKMVVEVFEK